MLYRNDRQAKLNRTTIPATSYQARGRSILLDFRLWILPMG